MKKTKQKSENNLPLEIDPITDHQRSQGLSIVTNPKKSESKYPPAKGTYVSKKAYAELLAKYNVSCNQKSSLAEAFRGVSEERNVLDHHNNRLKREAINTTEYFKMLTDERDEAKSLANDRKKKIDLCEEEANLLKEKATNTLVNNIIYYIVSGITIIYLIIHNATH